MPKPDPGKVPLPWRPKLPKLKHLLLWGALFYVVTRREC